MEALQEGYNLSGNVPKLRVKMMHRTGAMPIFRRQDDQGDNIEDGNLSEEMHVSRRRSRNRRRKNPAIIFSSEEAEEDDEDKSAGRILRYRPNYAKLKRKMKNRKSKQYKNNVYWTASTIPTRIWKFFE